MIYRIGRNIDVEVDIISVSAISVNFLNITDIGRTLVLVLIEYFFGQSIEY